MLLAHSGFEVQLAYTGPEALVVAERQKPDVAVLDIGMPGMSGYEVARAIRSQTWGTAMQLIAVTGWGQEDDKRKAKEAGFDHHLTKPIDPGALERLMAVPQPERRG
jgi:CheY-like chemotaxis protein